MSELPKTPRKKWEPHGHRPSSGGTSEYSSWRAMVRRCHDPRIPDYRYYGARGVTVCERWRDSLSNFLADMGCKPTPQHTIDRIDPTGNYEPGNCRWATRAEQSRNKISQVKLSVEGARVLRRLRQFGMPYQDIAQVFRISPRYAGNVCRGVAWKTD